MSFQLKVVQVCNPLPPSLRMDPSSLLPFFQPSQPLPYCACSLYCIFTSEAAWRATRTKVWIHPSTWARDVSSSLSFISSLEQQTLRIELHPAHRDHGWCHDRQWGGMDPEMVCFVLSLLWLRIPLFTNMFYFSITGAHIYAENFHCFRQEGHPFLLLRSPEFSIRDWNSVDTVSMASILMMYMCIWIFEKNPFDSLMTAESDCVIASNHQGKKCQICMYGEYRFDSHGGNVHLRKTSKGTLSIRWWPPKSTMLFPGNHRKRQIRSWYVPPRFL